jgi:hypothetical protein
MHVHPVHPPWVRHWLFCLVFISDLELLGLVNAGLVVAGEEGILHVEQLVNLLGSGSSGRHFSPIEIRKYSEMNLGNTIRGVQINSGKGQQDMK